MGMRDYAVDDYGLVLDEATTRLIASQMFDYFKDVDEEYGEGNWTYELYDNGICEYISEFTGEALLLKDNGETIFDKGHTYYNYEPVCYVQTSKYPTLFNKAYENMDDLVDEFKTKLGKYLPEDFDYRNNICKITGTYYG